MVVILTPIVLMVVGIPGDLCFFFLGLNIYHIYNNRDFRPLNLKGVSSSISSPSRARGHKK